MKPFHCVGCGDCCGPVPVTRTELKKIQKKLKTMPTRIKEQLKKPKNNRLTCMFRDETNQRCGIYAVRPEICRMFGRYEEMVCVQGENVHHATINKKEGMKHLAKVLKDEKPIGILTQTIGWDMIEKIKL